MEKQIWIDCGARADDCLAILAALSAPELHVIGLSAVSPKNSQADTLKTLRGMANLTGHSEIPCLIGSTEPIIQKSVKFQTPFIGSEFHHAADIDENAAKPDITDTIWEYAKKNPGLTLVTLGPLTNVARLLLAHPDIQKSLKEIVIAGGTSRQGNVFPRVEYNIAADPYAAHLILGSGIPVSLMTLEASQVSISAIDKISTLSVSPAVKEILDVCKRKCSEIQSQSLALHGLSAIISLLTPGAFEFRKCRVDVELKSSICMGQTVCDLTGVSGKNANTLVAVESNTSVYEQMLIELFKMTNEKLEKERS